MSYVHPAWLEGQRRRWQRHDWKRWVKPEAHHLYEPPPAEKARVDVVERDAGADAPFLAEVEALRADHQRVRIMLADLKFELALRGLGRKYSPDQPRVAAGNPDGGQWTSGGENAPKDGPGNPPPANSDADTQKILAMAKQLRLVAGPQDYQKCLDLAILCWSDDSRLGAIATRSTSSNA